MNAHAREKNTQKYVILNRFSTTMIRKRVSLLRYTYIACLVYISFVCLCSTCVCVFTQLCVCCCLIFIVLYSSAVSVTYPSGCCADTTIRNSVALLLLLLLLLLLIIFIVSSIFMSVCSLFKDRTKAHILVSNDRLISELRMGNNMEVVVAYRTLILEIFPRDREIPRELSVGHSAFRPRCGSGTHKVTFSSPLGPTTTTTTTATTRCEFWHAQEFFSMFYP